MEGEFRRGVRQRILASGPRKRAVHRVNSPLTRAARRECQKTLAHPVPNIVGRVYFTYRLTMFSNISCRPELFGATSPFFNMYASSLAKSAWPFSISAPMPVSQLA